MTHPKGQNMPHERDVLGNGCVEMGWPVFGVQIDRAGHHGTEKQANQKARHPQGKGEGQAVAMGLGQAAR